MRTDRWVMGGEGVRESQTQTVGKQRILAPSALAIHSHTKAQSKFNMIPEAAELVGVRHSIDIYDIV